MVNEKRNEIQQQATQAILRNRFTGILKVAPRVGKSKIVLDAMFNKMMMSDIPDKGINISIALPYRSIESSWKTEIKKWLGDLPFHFGVTYILHKDIHKCKHKFLIVDEIQDVFNSENKLNKLQQYTGKVLGLSGYMSKWSSIAADKLGYHTIFEYTVEQAVDDKVISDFEVVLVPVTLEKEVQDVLIEMKDSSFFTTEYMNYNLLTKKIDETVNQNYKRSMQGRRANYLYNYNKKFNIVKEYLDKINQRALVFTSRTIVADKFCESYHSKNAKDNNLQRFINQDIDKLAVCETVSMGITIPNLKIGIFHQVKSNSEKQLQKVLRMCNLEDSSSKAFIYMFYYENTRDEDWVNKAITSIPSRFIKSHK